MDKYKVLKEYFGYDSFRSGQEQLIDEILNGKDCLGIMPTGAGKSICFQIPALMMEGITLVISPLISLMKDQVNSLTQSGISAAYINASLSQRQMETVLSKLKREEYKIVYVAPERLQSEEFLLICKDIEISVVCVDEAHCVSHWGHDFRPSYLVIKDFISSIPKRPVVCAFTATATQRVRDDIIELLSLNSPFTIVTSFDRENLYFEVIKPKSKYIALKRYLDIYSGRSGIVYCSSRKTVDELLERLSVDGYSVTKYHAGLSKSERQVNQELFIKDEKEIIVATNAFGMGIDKSNVSFIIHYNMPGDIESYYQEAGRAGRDGSPADCVLFYNASDIMIQKYFIEHSEENEQESEKDKEAFKRLRYDKLDRMIAYSSAHTCLRNYILQYFGERPTEKCMNCSFCNGSGTSVDITIEGQKIFSLLKRVKGKEKKETVISLLKGEETDYIKENQLSKVKTFGAMEDAAKSEIEKLVDYFLSHGFIAVNEDGSLKTTERADPVLFSGKRIRKLKDKEKPKFYEIKEERPDFVLYSKLKLVRNEAAAKSSIPPFSVFTDATLLAMAKIKPKTRKEFFSVPGVSAKKFDKYGPLFLKAINENELLKEMGGDVDLELLEKLKNYIKDKARENSMPAFVILSDPVLKKIAGCKPKNMDELLSISGMDKNRAELYGNDILKIVKLHSAQRVVTKLCDPVLFSLLRSFRNKTAAKNRKPTYEIFQDYVLMKIAAEKPSNMEELLFIEGVSEDKAKAYGKEILKIIKEHSMAVEKNTKE